nr:penicillin acylase family protein [Aminobacter anthyllidis]
MERDTPITLLDEGSLVNIGDVEFEAEGWETDERPARNDCSRRSSSPRANRDRPLGHPAYHDGNEADLFLVQGFNAARDRLWQIDLWRKRGLGLSRPISMRMMPRRSVRPSSPASTRWHRPRQLASAVAEAAS